MAKLPLAPPPERLREFGLRPEEAIELASARTTLWRIHRTRGERLTAWNELRRYGPLPTGRFDPHDPPPHTQQAGVLYLACGVATCVAEVYQTTRRVDTRQGAPYLVALRLARPVRLLDLSSAWPTRAGASQAISSGPRSRCQGWARSIRSAFDDLEGVLYPSSMHAGEPCVALWDRAEDALPSEPVGAWPLDHPALAEPLAEIAARIGYGLV
jgi:RES domain-containing protein